MTENQNDPLVAYVPFVPPTDPNGGIIDDIYCWLTSEVNEFRGVEFIPLVDEDKGRDSNGIGRFNFEVNSEMVSDEQRPLFELAAEAQYGLFKLGQQANKNDDLYAAQLLVKSAIAACEYVKKLGATNPDLLRQLAQTTYQWPILATLGSELPDPPVNLGGEYLEMLGIKNTSFGGIEDIICRRYALKIVYAISMNRSFLNSVSDQFDRFVAFMEKKHERSMAVPSWLPKCASLPDLKRDTVDAWMAIGRDMVRTCDPDFYKRDEWNDYNLRAQKEAGKGNAIDGYKRRAIFNAIRAALKVIVVD